MTIQDLLLWMRRQGGSSLAVTWNCKDRRTVLKLKILPGNAEISKMVSDRDVDFSRAGILELVLNEMVAELQNPKNHDELAFRDAAIAALEHEKHRKDGDS